MINAIFINRKNKKKYKLINDSIINLSKDFEGTLWCLYEDENGVQYIRERIEFYAKFDKY